MKILITGVGGPTPRSFAIALKKYSNYKSYYLVGTDSNPLSIGLYQKDLFDKTCLVPPASHPDYWKVIDKIIEENSIEIAIILPEKEVLVWSMRMNETGLPCKSLIPELPLAELLIDKSKMTLALQSFRLVPQSVEFNRNQENLTNVFDLLSFPFWVRSTSGTSGLGSLKIENRESLTNWIDINPGVNQFLASEFLPGRNLACKLLYFDGKLRRAACAERVSYIMSKVAPSGITGNTSFGRFLNEPKLISIGEQAMECLFEVSGAKRHGFFTVDLKENDSAKPLITEINIRHVAFTQCFAAAGANLAEDTIRLLDGDSLISNSYKYYEFEKDLIFLRDVDSLPIIMKESDLEDLSYMD